MKHRLLLFNDFNKMFPLTFKWRSVSKRISILLRWSFGSLTFCSLNKVYQLSMKNISELDIVKLFEKGINSFSFKDYFQEDSRQYWEKNLKTRETWRTLPIKTGRFHTDEVWEKSIGIFFWCNYGLLLLARGVQMYSNLNLVSSYRT